MSKAKGCLASVFFIIIIMAFFIIFQNMGHDPSDDASTASQETSEQESQESSEKDVSEMDNVELSEKFWSELKVGMDSYFEQNGTYALEGNTFTTDFQCVAYKGDPNDPVVDINGAEYPYNFIVQESRKLKDSPIQFTYTAMIGYQTIDAIKNFQPVVLEYIDSLSGEHLLMIPEEESYIKAITDLENTLNQ